MLARLLSVWLSALVAIPALAVEPVQEGPTSAWSWDEEGTPVLPAEVREAEEQVDDEEIEAQAGDPSPPGDAEGTVRAAQPVLVPTGTLSSRQGRAAPDLRRQALPHRNVPVWGGSLWELGPPDRA